METKQAAQVPIKGYYIDPSSTLEWEGTLLGVYSHSGLISFSGGKFTLQGETPTMISAQVDMTSINPTDDNYSEENTREMLIGHLSSSDFFAVENFPQADLSYSGDGDPMLTIRGISHPVQLGDLEVKETSKGVSVSGSFEFNRQLFDVSYEGTGDAVLSDDIAVDFNIVGVSAN